MEITIISVCLILAIHDVIKRAIELKKYEIANSKYQEWIDKDEII